MRSAVGLLFVLSALVQTGLSLSCVSCVGLDKTPCTGNSTLCPPGTVCGSLFIRGSAVLYSVIRSCFQESQCNKTGTFSAGEYKGKEISNCCTTDNCSPSTPTWKKTPEIQHNGWKCPSCVPFPYDCVDTDEVSCSGDENYCFSQSLQIPGYGSVPLSGCSTESLCQFANFSLNSNLKINSTAHCTKANMSVFISTTMGTTTVSQVNGSNTVASSLHMCLYLCLAVIFLSSINHLA
ncbi:phospholipase A2 inhibitor subunit gamma B-like [Xenopus laevis]|uniref:Phospholipase A2 inhibitor subunit gamma B-like n=1 Tax=Xenopus laevis TaxID=8355 RepID=A0A8J1L821_XENLA|nr:phospholipase A2 inhibitor subunit gamma B-like [Xenopus laevis]